MHINIVLIFLLQLQLYGHSQRLFAVAIVLHVRAFTCI